MIAISLTDFHPWIDIPMLGAWLGLGAIVGVFYFRSLWRTTLWLSKGGHGGATAMLTIARFALMIGVLVVACLQGALPLLATSLGFFAARFAVMRRIKDQIKGTPP
jgi:F1F0 ATPase subunit 2